MEQEAKLPGIYVILGLSVLIACFFLGIIILPLIALLGLFWAAGALLVRSQY